MDSLSKAAQASHVCGHSKSTPVGFEPTRGDPIGLAGRRLNHSAKVSMPGDLLCCCPAYSMSHILQHSQPTWKLAVDGCIILVAGAYRFNTCHDAQLICSKCGLRVDAWNVTPGKTL